MSIRSDVQLVQYSVESVVGDGFLLSLMRRLVDPAGENSAVEVGLEEIILDE